jgi:hypothetical protein
MHLFPNLQTNNRSEADHKIELYKLVNNVKRSNVLQKGLSPPFLNVFVICFIFVKIVSKCCFDTMVTKCKPYLNPPITHF